MPIPIHTIIIPIIFKVLIIEYFSFVLKCLFAIFLASYMKYIAIATIISLVLPTFERVIKDNLKLYIRLEPKQDGKKVKKKKDN